jgi:hypothetical protein
MSQPLHDASFDQLEQAYETLALAIDRAGPDQEAVFLAKLALVLAERLSAPADFSACVEIALLDLDQSAGPYAQVIPRKMEQ